MKRSLEEVPKSIFQLLGSNWLSEFYVKFCAKKMASTQVTQKKFSDKTPVNSNVLRTLHWNFKSNPRLSRRSQNGHRHFF